MMGRSPASFEEGGLKKGPWTPEEDKKLVDYIRKHGHGCWRALPKNAGINRCGKSCRLRWTNYLRPDIKRGKFSKEEEDVIINIHSVIGNKWSAIASHLPGRTDNEIKNYWNTHLRKKLFQMGIDPITHRPRTDLSINNNNLLAGLPQLLAVANLFNQLDSNNALSLLHYPSNHATHQQLLATNEVNNLLQLLHTSAAHHNPPPQNLSGTSSAALQGQRGYMDLINMKSQLDQGLNDATLFNTLNNGASSSFELPNLEDHPQQKQEYASMLGSARDFGCNMSSNYQMPSNLFSVPRAENPMPSLVSSSPKNYGVHNNNFNNPDEIIGTSNPTSASTTCEAWAEFMDDGSSDSYWKDIEQASSSHGLLR